MDNEVASKAAARYNPKAAESSVQSKASKKLLLPFLTCFSAETGQGQFLCYCPE